jgi:NAD(P)H-hydrate repair Nnr-like enzyme with NAD(P)H-hydrate epimerase domain
MSWWIVLARARVTSPWSTDWMSEFADSLARVILTSVAQRAERVAVVGGQGEVSSQGYCQACRLTGAEWELQAVAGAPGGAGGLAENHQLVGSEIHDDQFAGAV